jgi:hypothetical protein
MTLTHTYDDRMAAAARAALTLYAQHPDLGFPTISSTSVSYHYYGDTAKTDLATTRRTLSAGTWAKRVTETHFILTSKLPDGVTLSLYAERDQVCERVVTGQETVETEAKVCPTCEGTIGPDGNGGLVCLTNGRTDYYAPPLKTVTRTDQVDKIEWQCLPVLAAPAREAVTA